jgi:hypothetical protein
MRGLLALMVRRRLIGVLIFAAWGLALTGSARAELAFRELYPRNGQLLLSDSNLAHFTFSSLALSTADSDESLKTATVTSADLLTTGLLTISGSAVFQAFGGTARLQLPNMPPVPFTGDVISEAPQQLDLANWAFAIGVSDGVSLKVFLQLRLAGSSATVSDPTLANQAVAAGLWTSPNEYFEFNPGHAGVALKVGPPGTGPNSFFGFVLPEPTTGWLLMPALGAAAMRRRRTG